MERNTSFFRYTFIEVLNKPKVALTTAFLLVLISCTLVGNSLVISTIFSTRRLRFPAFFFVASLAVADFLVGLFVLPISLAYHLTFEMEGKWIFGSFTCKAWLLANFWFCSASTLNLCLVSWDRYIAVTSPLHYNRRMGDNKVKRMIAISWTLSFSLALFVMTGIHLNTGSTTTNCTIQSLDRVFTGVGFVCVFFLPVLFLGFVNMKVWLVARRQKRRIQVNFHVAAPMCVSIDLPSTLGRGGRTMTRTIKQEVKTFKIFLIVIGVFVICWCPFYVSMVVNIFRSINTYVFYLTIVLSYCNSALNVFIYGTFSREFRKALVSAFKCM